MMLPTVQWPFALYWSSQQVQIVSGADGERVFARVCTYLALGLTFVAVLITLFVHPLLHVMVSPGFRSAAKYVPWLTVAYLMRAVGGHFREVFVIKKRPSVDARVSWVGTIVCLAGYAILIPKLGVWGAVYATAGSFAVLALYAFIAAQDLWRVHYEYDRLLKISISAVIPVGVFYWLQPESFWMQAGLGLLLTLASLALLQASSFWHDDEKAYFQRLWMGLQTRRQRVETDVA
jgi:O-antigen/teichoic acid export membrane protein